MGKKNKNNSSFIESSVLNNATFNYYLNAFRKVCLSMFEWRDLPDTMNEQWLEKSLFEFGKASLLKDENYGFINTKCTSSGEINIYGLPSKLNCFSYGYNIYRNLFTGSILENSEYTDCILVQNNWDMLPTLYAMQLFAYRLYNCDRCIDININRTKNTFNFGNY